MSAIIDKLFVQGGRHLGDQFVLAGIINHFADICGELHYAVSPNHRDTIFSLFRERSNIVLVECSGQLDEENYIRSQGGMSRLLHNQTTSWRQVNGKTVPVKWDLELYEYYNLPFSMRYTNFRCPTTVPGSIELYNCLSLGRPYILIHRASSERPNGLPIDYDVVRRSNGLPNWPYEIVEVGAGITSDMMQYLDLIKNAEEIHCIDSSFFCLVDSIYDQVRGKLYMHDLRALSLYYQYNLSNWNIIAYPSRY